MQGNKFDGVLRDGLNVVDKNTMLRLFDRDGNIVPLWQENRLGKFLRERLRELRVAFVTGRYSDAMLTHNLVTNVGHAAMNGRASNQGGYSPFVNIGLGQGTASAAATDEALGNEITSAGGARGAATASQVTTTVASDTTQLVKTFTFTGSFAVTEEAIFDSATAPTVTTLSAAIVSTSATSISVASGAGITNNDYIQIDNEILQVTAGGGTTSLTVTRGQKGTTAATHLINVGVVDINTSGNALAKQTFAVINVTSGMSLQITHDYQT